MIKYFILLSLIFICAHDIFPKAEGCIKFFKANVTIVNDIPRGYSKPIFVRCKSKDDDLGTHLLRTGQSWGFKFCVIPFSTLFSCGIEWGSQFHVDLKAYDAKWLFVPCENNRHCTWTADANGVSSKRGEFHPWIKS
ncbi:plant self-incompatibility protein S1 family [Striga asiatica]|uniref:S-protein homolog n=1 Tax=Striga asiatica TaxID=4170 RepID=A0A5A7R176_STRAF|nr:plant self-incompatibility protein S1 family [Striga asiatica]